MRNDCHRLKALLILLCVAGGSACLLMYVQSAVHLPTPAAGSTIPDMSVTSIVGEAQRLRGILRGRCLLVVYRTECAKCRYLLKRLPALRSPVRVVGLSLSSAAATRDWIAETGSSYPIYLLSPETARRDLGIRTTPKVMLMQDSVIRTFIAGPALDSLFASDTTAPGGSQ